MDWSFNGFRIRVPRTQTVPSILHMAWGIISKQGSRALLEGLWACVLELHQGSRLELLTV